MEAEKILDFKWFGDLLRESFPEYLKDYHELSSRQSGLTEKGLLVQRLKEEAGEIPDQTCADIDRVISGINGASDSLNDCIKKIDRDNDAWDYVNDAEKELDGLESILEKLRDENSRLRDLGKFWYEKFTQLKP